MNTERDEIIFEPLAGTSFRFGCHKGISCFNRCCAGLRLILTPYDILRMKIRLGFSSDEFLERYADAKMDAHPRFPMVTLRMEDDGNKNCPFVTPEGCRIYEDRPGACRIYPLGRAAMKVDREKDAREKFFLVHEGHCLGFQEEKEWSKREWMAHEGVDEYADQTVFWVFHGSRCHNGRHVTTEAHQQGYECASMESNPMHRPVGQKSHPGHVARILEQGDKQEEQHDVWQKDSDTADTGQDAFYQHIP